MSLEMIRSVELGSLHEDGERGSVTTRRHEIEPWKREEGDLHSAFSFHVEKTRLR